MKTEHLNWLKKNDACGGSIKWVEENNISTLEDAWNTCNRGDWLLWMADKLGIDKHKMTICGALCAHTVVEHMENPRSRNAVRVAFLFGRGKATLEELKEARIAAWAAAAAAAAAAAWAVAAAAAAAADAAAWAVAAAAAAVDDAADDDKKENQRITAEIARKLLTEDVFEKLKEIK